ncbi:hypothetical protein OSB04_010844 [Centaurea solstitialis]|uniref:RRM domain-containing protein n=1 Tax=Centaurea solstitialis TaxID=347529 RepID=A0AA38T8B7_9ASTR|nr:hypothetical protein OSB04_010844 [Centaurea solstitialis]
MNVANLLRIFKRFGEVRDIYMARRLLKCGKKFGFIRFRKEGDITLLLRKLKNIWIGSHRLRVYPATMKKGYQGAFSSKGQDGRFGPPGVVAARRNQVYSGFDSRVRSGSKQEGNPSFAKVLLSGLKGNNEGQKEEIEEKGDQLLSQKEVIAEWGLDEKMLSYMNRCLIGDLECIDNLEGVRALTKEKALDIVEAKRLGGRQVMIMVSQESILNEILHNKAHGIHHWIKGLSRWSVGHRNAERLTWLKISGMPLHGWNEALFTEIASKWGKVLKTLNCSLEEVSNLAWGKILISTHILSSINCLSSIKLGHFYYRIKVEEEDSSLQGLFDSGVIADMSDGVASEFEGDSSSSSRWSGEDENGEDEGGVEETWLEGVKEFGQNNSQVAGAEFTGDKIQGGGEYKLGDEHKSTGKGFKDGGIPGNIQAGGEKDLAIGVDEESNWFSEKFNFQQHQPNDVVGTHKENRHAPRMKV